MRAELIVSLPPVVPNQKGGLGGASVRVAPPVTVGVAMALEPGRGRTAVPVRPAIAGAVVAVLGVVAVGVFGSSLAHLVDTPPTFGYNWNAHITVGAPDQIAQVVRAIVRHPEFHLY